MYVKSPAWWSDTKAGRGTNPFIRRKEPVPVTKVQQENTCKPWCSSHDDETGTCVTDYRFTPLSLETPITQFEETRPAQMHTLLETGPDGEPRLVTFASDGTGTSMTPGEALAYAAQLSALARMALGVA